jgi:hypothetical protein
MEKEDECSDIEKREGSVGPRFQPPLEVEVLAIERIERRMDGLRRDARAGLRPLTIRSRDIEEHSGTEKLLRYKWMYRQ